MRRKRVVKKPPKVNQEKALILEEILRIKADVELAELAYRSKHIRRKDQGMTGIGYNYKKGWNGIRTNPYGPLTFDDI